MYTGDIAYLLWTLCGVDELNNSNCLHFNQALTAVWPTAKMCRRRNVSMSGSFAREMLMSNERGTGGGISQRARDLLMDLFRSVFPACGYVAWGSVCLGRYSRVRCSHSRGKAWVGDIRINVHLKFILSWDCVYRLINPLTRHDALKHHSTSLKTYFFFLQPRVLESIFPWDWFTNIWQSSLIFHPHQIIFIHYKSRIAIAIRGL